MIVRQRTTSLIARQWVGTNVQEISNWIGAKLIEHNVAAQTLLIDRRSGRVIVRNGEWIVSMDYDLLVFPSATFDVIFEEVKQ